MDEAPHPQSAPQPAPLDLNSPNMRRVMKESAYQLAEKLQKFLKKEELRFFTEGSYTHPRSQPPIHDNLRVNFNHQYDQWYQTLVLYFGQTETNTHIDPVTFGTLDVQPWTMAHAKALEIIKLRIGWLLLTADKFIV